MKSPELVYVLSEMVVLPMEEPDVTESFVGSLHPANATANKSGR